MTVTMIDGTNSAVGFIPAGAAKVAGYTTGYAWSDADWHKFSGCKVRINQGYRQTAETADVNTFDTIDVEQGAWNPSDVPTLVKRRIDAGHQWTTIYGTDSTLAAVHDALVAFGTAGWWYGHVNCWLANWNLNAADAANLVSPTASGGKEIHGMTCAAVQWASPTSNPQTGVPGSTLTLAQANVDLSETAEWWCPSAPAPTPPPPAPTPPPVPKLFGAVMFLDALHQLESAKVESDDNGRTWHAA